MLIAVFSYSMSSNIALAGSSSNVAFVHMLKMSDENNKRKNLEITDPFYAVKVNLPGIKGKWSRPS